MASRNATKIGAVEPNRPALGYLYSRLPFLLQRVDQIAGALFSAETEGLNITPLQYQFLELIGDGAPLAQIDLARRAGIDASTTGLVLANLIKRYWVRRTTDPSDRRRKIVALTRPGAELRMAAAAAYLRVQRQLFRPLGGDSPMLVAALGRMVSIPSAAPAWEPPMDLAGGEGCGAPVLGSISFLVRRALQQTEANMAAEIGPRDLTVRQYATLLVICFHAGIGESGITRLLGYESSNAGLIVQLLLAKDLIEAEQTHARGRRRYRATTAGKALMLAIEPGLSRAEVSLVADVPGDEVVRIQRLLGRMVTALDPAMRFPLALFAEITGDPGWPGTAQWEFKVDISIVPG